MRSLPRISLTTHGLLELLAGVALTFAALVLDLGGAGTVLVFAAGVSLAGIGLGATDALPLAAHQSIDRTLAIALAAAAIGCALAGTAVAALILLATSTAVLALEAGTRWTRPVAQR
jgi:hypothetical membrane protein